jgi:hypothetical protein
MIKQFHKEIFPEEQTRLFDLLSDFEWIKEFYLAGGTGIALQLGHRPSIDFNFFSQKKFDASFVLEQLLQFGKVKLNSRSKSILDCYVNEVRISFFYYQYPLIENTIVCSNINIASLLDIGVMKLEAISGRGSRKDFIDLFYLLKIYTLKELLQNYPKKYGIELSNHYHLLQSLVYFKDAERIKMPKVFAETSWGTIKETIINEVKNIDFKNLM